MGKYRKVNRCKSCGKIYAKGIPYFCDRCGTEIGIPTSTLMQLLGSGEVTLTEQCEKVIAKRSLFGWKVRKADDTEVVQ